MAGGHPACLTYLFTIIDRTSRWPEAILLASITTADCARALFAGWVSRFGVPATITSDRGVQFTSALWAGLCSLLNIQHSPTTAYNPQSNGLVERFHRRLKDALRSRAAAADWHNHLPWVLGIRTSFSFHRRRRCTRLAQRGDPCMVALLAPYPLVSGLLSGGEWTPCRFYPPSRAGRSELTAPALGRGRHR
jgi:hypothetical protein